MRIDCTKFEKTLYKILDNRATAEEKEMFFRHISECEACSRKYAEAKAIKSALSAPARIENEAFTAGVINRIHNLPPKKRSRFAFSGFMRFAAPALVCLVLAAALLTGVFFFGQRQNMIAESLSQQNDTAEQGTRITENESDYIRKNYMGFLFDGAEIPDNGTYTDSGILDLLSQTVDGFVNDEYGYIMFMTVSDIDNLNKAEKTVYMPRTNNGDIMIFTTALSQMGIVSSVGDELVDYYVLDAENDSDRALLVVRLDLTES